MQKSCPDKNKEGLLSSLGDEISLLTQVKQQVEEAIARSVSQGLTANFPSSQSAPGVASVESVGVSALSDTDSCEDSQSGGRKGSGGAVLMQSLCDSSEQGPVKREAVDDEEGHPQYQDSDIAQGSTLNSNWVDIREQEVGDLIVMADGDSTTENEEESEASRDPQPPLEGDDLATFESSFLPTLPLCQHFLSSEHL